MRKTKVAEIYTGGHNKQNKPDSRQNEPINKNNLELAPIIGMSIIFSSLCFYFRVVFRDSNAVTL